MNLENLGLQELDNLGRALIMLSDRLYPTGFSTDGLNIFIPEGQQEPLITNDYDQTLAIDGDQLSYWHILPSGHEGTEDQLLYDYENGNLCKDDIEYMERAGIF